MQIAASSILTPDPGLPTNLLPPPIESWLTTTATLAGVPPVMVALPFLAGAGAVIGNRLGLALHPGWIEHPAIWVALVALTGTGKTPALTAARLPFDRLHTESLDRWHNRPAEDAKTPFTPLIATRATWNQLQATLQHTPGLLLLRDELVGFIRAIDRRAGEDRQSYLSLWSCTPLVNGASPAIATPVVSIVGGIQPLLIQRIRHRYQDGLLERFLLVLAGAQTVPWDQQLPSTPPPIEPVMEMLRLLHNPVSAHTVSLEPDARALWIDWYNANISLTFGAPLVLGGFYRKLPTHLARLALVIHALWNPANPGQPLSPATLDRAIALVEYLRIHMHRSLILINERHPHRSPATLLSNRIVHHLTSQRNQEWLNRSRLFAALGKPSTSSFNTALATLLESGHIEERRTPTSGRPAIQYRLLGPQEPSERRQNNPHDTGEN